MNINDIYSFILSCSLTDLEKRVKSDDFDGFATTLSFIIETRMSEATTDQFDKARFDRRKSAFGWSTAQLQQLKEAERKSDVREF